MSRTVIGLDADAKPITTDIDVRSKHEFVLGPTGSGKSRYLDYRIRQDIAAGYGVCVIDPDGDDPGSVFKSTLRWLKHKGYWDEKESRRARQVRILDISARDVVTSLNPFFTPPRAGAEPEPWILARSLCAVFERVWKQDFSEFPTIQKLLPSLFVLLMERGLTLADAPMLLGNGDEAKGLRQRLLDNAIDQVAKRNLLDEHEKSPRDFDAAVLAVRNRIAEFTNIPRVRQMFSGGGTPLDLHRVMDESEILLVNLAPDDYHAADKQVAQIVGTWLIRECYRLARTRRSRTPFYLYIDEAADYLTDDIPDILFKSRKRGLSLIMAAQTLQQLRDAGDTIYSAVTQQTNIVSVFGGLPADAVEMVDTLFDLNPETPVALTVRPMPNGRKVIVNLASESASVSRANTTGQADMVGRSKSEFVGRTLARGETAGRGSGVNLGQTLSPLVSADGTPMVIVHEGSLTSSQFAQSVIEGTQVGTAYGESAAVSRSRAETEGQTLSRGSQEALVDEYENFVSSVHSLESVRYQAAVLLRRLPRRHFFVSLDKQPAVRAYVPTVLPHDEVTERALASLVSAINAADPAVMTVAAAKENLKHPESRIAERLGHLPFAADPSVGRRIDDDVFQPFAVPEPKVPPADGDNVVPFPGPPEDDA